MEQYILKAPIVAEIDSIAADAICQYNSDKSRYAEGVIDVVHRIKHLLKTLEVTDIDAIRCNWYNQGYLKGRKEANIPARELGLPSELNTLEVKDNSLEKFKSLQHISRDLRSALQDWGYAPNLYHFDRSWHVDWIHCEEGDSIEGFTAETPEEVIDKAYNWFHSKFCNS